MANSVVLAHNAACPGCIHLLNCPEKRADCFMCRAYTTNGHDYWRVFHHDPDNCVPCKAIKSCWDCRMYGTHSCLKHSGDAGLHGFISAATRNAFRVKEEASRCDGSVVDQFTQDFSVEGEEGMEAKLFQVCGRIWEGEENNLQSKVIGPHVIEAPSVTLACIKFAQEHLTDVSVDDVDFFYTLFNPVVFT